MDRLKTPDLPDRYDAEALFDRKSFRVGDREFVRTEPGEYVCGNVKVYCDQQDSTSWACSFGAMSTGYYWTPEFAVLAAFPEGA